MALTLVYLLAIFPLAYSDRLTLKYLIQNPSEIENMFWYVFGTFTNSLTFQGDKSWSNSKKSSTRLLIGENTNNFQNSTKTKQVSFQGFYWVFTIIITACYTGSIIAFVTLPIFPETVDSISQLNERFYRVGTLDRGGWERWFLNSTDRNSERLIRRLETVRNVEEGLGNVTKPFFLFPYAFIGSKSQLEYIIRTNYTDNRIGRRSALHVSDNCFVLYGVSVAFQMHSVYREKINNGIMELQQSGLLDKIRRDIRWDFYRSTSGRHLEINVGKTMNIKSQEERGLTLADTEGMFLLLGIGFLIAGGALVSEWVGGCTNKCIRIVKTKREKDQADRDEATVREEHHLRELEIAQGALDSITAVVEIKPNCIDEKGDEKGENCSKASPSEFSGSHHSRGSSIAAMNDLSPSMLREMYEGPGNRHQLSNVVMLDGKLMTESDAAKRRRRVESVAEVQTPSYDREISESFDFLKLQEREFLSTDPDVDDDDEGCGGGDENYHTGSKQTVKVEINAATPVGWENENEKDKKVTEVDHEHVFGEKVEFTG